jgi:hypothetical protein
MKRAPEYRPGDWIVDCDVCGLTFWASELKKMWNGSMVCRDDFNERHPADFPKVVRDDQRVPFTRHHTDTFITAAPADPDSLGRK